MTLRHPLAWAICSWALLLASVAALGQEQPVAKSSAAAIRQYRDAVAFQNRGVYDLAADEWGKFLKQFADDPLASKAQHYLGICQLQLKQYDEAAASLAAVVGKYPKFELLESTYLNLGLAQYSQAQAGKPELFDTAATTFSTLAEKFPQGDKLPTALFFLGESLYARQKKAEAAKAYGLLVDRFPKAEQRADALYALGVAREELGQAAEAGAAYDLFLKEFAQHALRAEVTMRRGETLFAAGKFADAEKWFAAAAGMADFALADQSTMRQAASLYQQKKYAEAASLYAAVPGKYPRSAHVAAATLAAGNCHYLAGNLDEAKKWLAAAIKLGGPGAPEAAHWLCRALLKQSQPAEALKVAEAALPGAGASPLAVQLLMDQADAVYEQPSRRGEAVALYAALADKHADHALAPQALYLAAFTALGVGDHAKALQFAERFLKSHAADPLAADVKYVAAEAGLQSGRHAGAESLYRELLAAQANHPDAPQWKVRLALALLLQKKHAEVVKELEPVAAGLGKPELVAEGWHLIGSAQLELQQYDAAAKALSAALTAAAAWRQADETLLNLALAQRQLKQAGAAKASLQRLLTDFPQTRLADRARYRLGELAYAAGDFAGAAAEYQRVIETTPGSPLAPHALFGLGWSLSNQKDYSAAADVLTRLLDQHAGHALAPKARYARAVCRQQLQQFDAALADVAEFLKSSPAGGEKSDALYVQGLALAGQKKPVEAAAVFQSLLTADPKYAGADKVLYEWAWALKSRNQEQDAAGLFARLAAEHGASPLAAEACFHSGEFQYQNKDYAQAAAAYQAAAEKAGKSEVGEKATHKLGWSQYQQAQFDKAGQTFARQVSDFPQGELAADGRFMAAEATFKQNQFADAYAAYQALLTAPPASKDFQVLARLHAGQSAAQLKKWDESLRLLEKCAADFPDTAYLPELLYEQGWARQNLGQLEPAMKLYERVAGLTEREVGARARFMLGEALFEKKEHKEAIRQFFKVAYAYGYPRAAEPVRKWQAKAAYEAGRCFEVLQDTKQAIGSYREVVEKYPQSEHAAAAKDRIAALGGS